MSSPSSSRRYNLRRSTRGGETGRGRAEGEGGCGDVRAASAAADSGSEAPRNRRAAAGDGGGSDDTSGVGGGGGGGGGGRRGTRSLRSSARRSGVTVQRRRRDQEQHREATEEEGEGGSHEIERKTRLEPPQHAYTHRDDDDDHNRDQEDDDHDEDVFYDSTTKMLHATDPPPPPPSPTITTTRAAMRSRRGRPTTTSADSVATEDRRRRPPPPPPSSSSSLRRKQRQQHQEKEQERQSPMSTVDDNQAGTTAVDREGGNGDAKDHDNEDSHKRHDEQQTAEAAAEDNSPVSMRMSTRSTTARPLSARASSSTASAVKRRTTPLRRSVAPTRRTQPLDTAPPPLRPVSNARARSTSKSRHAEQHVEDAESPTVRAVLYFQDNDHPRSQRRGPNANFSDDSVHTDDNRRVVQKLDVCRSTRKKPLPGGRVDSNATPSIMKESNNSIETDEGKNGNAINYANPGTSEPLDPRRVHRSNLKRRSVDSTSDGNEPRKQSPLAETKATSDVPGSATAFADAAQGFSEQIPPHALDESDSAVRESIPREAVAVDICPRTSVHEREASSPSATPRSVDDPEAMHGGTVATSGIAVSGACEPSQMLPEVDVVFSMQNWSRAELIHVCRSLGLATRGNRHMLQLRINHHMNHATKNAPRPPAVEPSVTIVRAQIPDTLMAQGRDVEDKDFPARFISSSMPDVGLGLASRDCQDDKNSPSGPAGTSTLALGDPEASKKPVSQASTKPVSLAVETAESRDVKIPATASIPSLDHIASQVEGTGFPFEYRSLDDLQRWRRGTLTSDSIVPDTIDENNDAQRQRKLEHEQGHQTSNGSQPRDVGKVLDTLVTAPSGDASTAHTLAHCNETSSLGIDGKPRIRPQDACTHMRDRDDGDEDRVDTRVQCDREIPNVPVESRLHSQPRNEVLDAAHCGQSRIGNRENLECIHLSAAVQSQGSNSVLTSAPNNVTDASLRLKVEGTGIELPETADLGIVENANDTNVEYQTVQSGITDQSFDNEAGDMNSWVDANHVALVGRTKLISVDMASGIITRRCDPTTSKMRDLVDGQLEVAPRQGSSACVKSSRDQEPAMSHSLARVVPDDAQVSQRDHVHGGALEPVRTGDKVEASGYVHGDILILQDSNSGGFSGSGPPLVQSAKHNAVEYQIVKALPQQSSGKLILPDGVQGELDGPAQQTLGEDCSSVILKTVPEASLPGRFLVQNRHEVSPFCDSKIDISDFMGHDGNDVIIQNIGPHTRSDRSCLAASAGSQFKEDEDHFLPEAHLKVKESPSFCDTDHASQERTPAAGDNELRRDCCFVAGMHGIEQKDKDHAKSDAELTLAPNAVKSPLLESENARALSSNIECKMIASRMIRDSDKVDDSDSVLSKPNFKTGDSKPNSETNSPAWCPRKDVSISDCDADKTNLGGKEDNCKEASATVVAPESHDSAVALEHDIKAQNQARDGLISGWPGISSGRSFGEREETEGADHSVELAAQSEEVPRSTEDLPSTIKVPGEHRDLLNKADEQRLLENTTQLPVTDMPNARLIASDNDPGQVMVDHPVGHHRSGCAFDSDANRSNDSSSLHDGSPRATREIDPGTFAADVEPSNDTSCSSAENEACDGAQEGIGAGRESSDEYDKMELDGLDHVVDGNEPLGSSDGDGPLGTSDEDNDMSLARESCSSGSQEEDEKLSSTDVEVGCKRDCNGDQPVAHRSLAAKEPRKDSSARFKAAVQNESGRPARISGDVMNLEDDNVVESGRASPEDEYNIEEHSGTENDEVCSIDAESYHDFGSDKEQSDESFANVDGGNSDDAHIEVREGLHAQSHLPSDNLPVQVEHERSDQPSDGSNKNANGSDAEYGKTNGFEVASDHSSDDPESVDIDEVKCIERNNDETALMPLTEQVVMSDLRSRPCIQNSQNEKGGLGDYAAAVVTKSPPHINPRPSELGSHSPSRCHGEDPRPIIGNDEFAESPSGDDAPAQSPIFIKPVPVRASINRASAISRRGHMGFKPRMQDKEAASCFRVRGEADKGVSGAANDKLAALGKASMHNSSKVMPNGLGNTQGPKDNSQLHIPLPVCSNADEIDDSVDGPSSARVGTSAEQAEAHVLLNELPTPDATIEELRGAYHDFGQSSFSAANRSQGGRKHTHVRAATSGQEVESLVGRLERIERSLKAQNQPGHGKTRPRLYSPPRNGRARLWSQVDVCAGGNEESSVVRVPSRCAWNVPALVSQTAALASSLGDTMNDWKGWPGKRIAIGNSQPFGTVPPRFSYLSARTDEGEMEDQTVGLGDGKLGDSAKKRRRI